jgi:uncharacterized protein with beta-barrel porin domain
LTLVIAGGGISGEFANLLDTFSPVITPELVYGQNTVVLEFRPDFESLSLTPNQRAAGKLLDQIGLSPKAAEPINFLFSEPVSNIPGDLEKISPDGLTAFYEISFSNANIQRLNLEGRLDDLRSGSNGFSSNMKVNGATVNLEDKAIVDGKSSKNTVEQVLQPAAENRWGVWVTGFGDFVNVDADSNAKGYDFTIGGVSLGVDYRLTDQLAIGVMGEYAHTWTSLQQAEISMSIAVEAESMPPGSTAGFISMEQSTAVTTSTVRAGRALGVSPPEVPEEGSSARLSAAATISTWAI